MSKKIYDSKLHKQVGDPGEIEAIRYFINRKNVTRVNRFPFNEFDVDLEIILSSGNNLYVDCEVRTNWIMNDFPFATIHIPERKAKFIKNRTPFLYMAIRKDLKKAILIPENCIDLNNVEEGVWNKYVQYETFISVDSSKGIYVDL